MKSHIHIIGGGVIGLCSAWYLREEGFDVTIIDKSDYTDGASYGNAGMITPSHFIPLANAGVLKEGMKWMLDSKSPFYIRLQPNIELIKWLYAFLRSCSSKKVQHAMPLLAAFNLWSKSLYNELSSIEGFDFEYEEKGLLMLYKNKKAALEERKTAVKASDFGLITEIWEGSKLQEKDRNIDPNVIGGVWYKNDAHLYPNQFMHQLKSKLEASGVTFIKDNELVDIRIDKGSVSQLKILNGETIKCDKLLMAGGAWSAQILKKIGIKILLQGGKGYSFTIPNNDLGPKFPTILTEAKVAMTPMGNNLRIGGTLEIDQFRSSVNMKRVEGIFNGVRQYYPKLNLKPRPEDIWYGYRPCSPDGMPYVGKTKISNLYVATGHAMMGMSLGPATGKLMSQIITNKKTTIDTTLMEVDRF